MVISKASELSLGEPQEWLCEALQCSPCVFRRFIRQSLRIYSSRAGAETWAAPSFLRHCNDFPSINRNLKPPWLPWGFAEAERLWWMGGGVRGELAPSSWGLLCPGKPHGSGDTTLKEQVICGERERHIPKQIRRLWNRNNHTFYLTGKAQVLFSNFMCNTYKMGRHMLLLFIFWDRVSLWSPGKPWIHHLPTTTSYVARTRGVRHWS